MKIHCPHQLEIETITLGDIRCYRHIETQEFCRYMNDFDARASEIGAAYIDQLHYEQEITPIMRVVLLSSKDARKRWYLLLSRAHGDVLKTMLLHTLQIISIIPSMRDIIVGELYTTFGQVVMTNLSEAYKRRIVVPPAEIDTSAEPILPMECLIKNDLVNTSIEIEIRQRSRKDRKRDTIEALYNAKKV